MRFSENNQKTNIREVILSAIGDSKAEELRADIVIIGGGGSGLAAATAAAEAGVKNIIVLEKAARLGGNARFVMGIFAAESPVQRRLGINVPKDKAFRDYMEYSKWAVDAKLVRTFINKSADIIEWLEAKGLNFTEVIRYPFDETAPEEYHMLEGGKLALGRTGTPIIETLLKECQNMGVKFLCQTRAKKILTDGKGKVTGVLAATKDKELRINTKSIIIAAGGFARNKKMLNKYFPQEANNVFTMSSPGMTGDGTLMAEEVGAITDEPIAINTFGPVYVRFIKSNKISLLSRRPEALWVNKNGERFTDESLYAIQCVGGAAPSLSRQPGSVCYALLDSTIKEHVIQRREILAGHDKHIEEDGVNWVDKLDNHLQRDEAKGTVKIADSWDEIAGWIGVIPEELKATVEQYNSFCDKGYDADFLKDRKYLLPLCTPPYYAISCFQAFDTTLGSIRINHRMEVINKQFSPISGLYAAGDNANGVISYYYFYRYPGTGAGFTFFSGYSAGENAAKYVRMKHRKEE